MEERSTWKRSRAITAAIIILLGVIPVSAYRGNPQGQLSGRVTLNGKPVVMGQVVALGADGVLRTAPIDPQGRYSFPALPVGSVRLGVISRDPGQALIRRARVPGKQDPLSAEDRGGVVSADRKQWFAVPSKYEDPRFSGQQSLVEAATSFDVALR
jgi:hypothetical protein